VADCPVPNAVLQRPIRLLDLPPEVLKMICTHTVSVSGDLVAEPKYDLGLLGLGSREYDAISGSPITLSPTSRSPTRHAKSPAYLHTDIRDRCTNFPRLKSVSDIFCRIFAAEVYRANWPGEHKLDQKLDDGTVPLSKDHALEVH
jgi:hypothetical protein